jgi:hypothetical protein
MTLSRCISRKDSSADISEQKCIGGTIVLVRQRYIWNISNAC